MIYTGTFQPQLFCGLGILPGYRKHLLAQALEGFTFVTNNILPCILVITPFFYSFSNLLGWEQSGLKKISIGEGGKVHISACLTLTKNTRL